MYGWANLSKAQVAEIKSRGLGTSCKYDTYNESFLHAISPQKQLIPNCYQLLEKIFSQHSFWLSIFGQHSLLLLPFSLTAICPTCFFFLVTFWSSRDSTICFIPNFPNYVNCVIMDKLCQGNMSVLLVLRLDGAEMLALHVAFQLATHYVPAEVLFHISGVNQSWYI